MSRIRPQSYINKSLFIFRVLSEYCFLGVGLLLLCSCRLRLVRSDAVRFLVSPSFSSSLMYCISQSIQRYQRRTMKSIDEGDSQDRGNHSRGEEKISHYVLLENQPLILYAFLISYSQSGQQVPITIDISNVGTKEEERRNAYLFGIFLV